MSTRSWPDFLLEVQNPFTRFAVRIEPPLLIASEGEYQEVTGKVTAYCRVAWEGPVRCNPKVIPSDWLRPDEDDSDIKRRGRAGE